MPTRRVLRSVIHNFLETYASRYSDYDGYWLFGVVIRELVNADLDLLATIERSEDLMTSTHELAARTFADQVAKSGLDRSWIAAARLRVERMSAANPLVDYIPRGGWDHRFHASVTTDTGRTYECESVVFVAPHDPRIERRSTRAGDTPTVSGKADM